MTCPEPEEKETESDHTENHESVEEMDAKAMVAREAQEIMETEAAKAETVTEKPQLSKQEAAVKRQATTQIENCVVIIQWQYTQILLQLLESITNLLGIVLMGFCIGMVELIQYRLTIRIARVKGMS